MVTCRGTIEAASVRGVPTAWLLLGDGTGGAAGRIVKSTPPGDDAGVGLGLRQRGASSL